MEHRGGVPPCCVTTTPSCALRGRLNWPWSCGGLIIVREPPFPPPTTTAPTPTLQFGVKLDWEWDVTNPAHCRIWHSILSIVLHIDLHVCAISNWDWHLQRSQLLSTLHWTVLPESSSANCGRINQRFLSTETTLLCLFKKVCPLEDLFLLYFLCAKIALVLTSLHHQQIVEYKKSTWNF